MSICSRISSIFSPKEKPLQELPPNEIAAQLLQEADQILKQLENRWQSFDGTIATLRKGKGSFKCDYRTVDISSPDALVAARNLVNQELCGYSLQHKDEETQRIRRELKNLLRKFPKSVA